MHSWFVFFGDGLQELSTSTGHRKAGGRGTRGRWWKIGSDTGEKTQQPQAGSRGFPGPREAGQGEREAVGGV